MIMNINPKFGFILSMGVLVVTLACATIVFHNKFSSKYVPNKRVNIERDFTPEQKAVINAVRQAQADLDKSKAELVQLIADAKATAIAKNLDPSVKTEYIAHGVNGSWAIRDRTNPVPVLLGFRSDRIVTWKFADE